MTVSDAIPEAWRELLDDQAARLAELQDFVAAERARHAVFPPEGRVFAALAATSPDRVRVVIVGQDPYHDDGQAHGLAFSVRPGVRFPPSLRNIFKELASDLNLPMPETGCLIPWAEQGVLLLNTVLTVRAHQPGSHQKHGWEPFTDAVISALSEKREHLVFVLWGAPAQSKLPLIDQKKHTVICSVHPSPLSAHRGFFGSRPFSAINRDLAAHGMKGIDWNLAADGASDDLPGLFQ